MDQDIKYPFLKGISAAVIWLGTVNWSTVAQVLAALYTALLITEWWWKKVWRPLFVRRGWIKGKAEFMAPTAPGDLT